MCKISVVVPVYNAQPYIAACLESLMAQRHRDLEILVVDDGSTDGSPKIIERYMAQDSRIVLYQQPNSGVGVARNTALKNATGDWIAFCDSDDRIPANAYQSMLSAGIRRNADVVVGTFRVQRENEILTFRYHRKSDNFLNLFHGPSLCNRLFKASLIKGLYFEPLTVGEDIVFLSQIFLRATQIVPISKTVYIYLNHVCKQAPSLTHINTLATFQCHINCWKLAKSYWDDKTSSYSNSYLICHTIPYLFQRLLLLSDQKEKCAGLQALRAFIYELDWSGYQQEFKATFGIDYREFLCLSEEEYFNRLIAIDTKVWLLQKFESGQIGLQYIKKYFTAWLCFKMRRLTRFKQRR